MKLVELLQTIPTLNVQVVGDEWQITVAVEAWDWAVLQKLISGKGGQPRYDYLLCDVYCLSIQMAALLA